MSREADLRKYAARMPDPRLADAMLAVGIIDTDQADRLRAELERITAEDMRPEIEYMTALQQAPDRPRAPRRRWRR